MSQNITFNGNGYVIPDLGEINWGQNLTDFFVAIPSGALQPTGGAFSLTAEVDFGGAFGLKSLYFKSRTANAASAGVVRLANADTISFRNAANSGDLTLGVNGSNQLTFNGVVLESDTLPDGQIFIGNASNSSTPNPVTGDIAITNTGVVSISAGVIVNADINAAAAIDYSKLNVPAGAIAYSKLTLTGSIVNADINASAAIAFTKMASLTASRMLVSSSGGVVTSSAWSYNATDDLVTGINDELRFTDGTTNYVAFKSPATVTTHTYNLPIAAGTAGQVLSWQAGGQLQWINAAGGGTINSGTSGQFAFYGATGTTLSGTPLLTTDSSTYVLSSVQIRSSNSFRVDGAGGADLVDLNGSTAGTLSIRFAPDGATSNSARIRGTQNGLDTDISFLTGGLERVRVTAAGQALFSDGTSLLPGMSFISDPDSGIRSVGANLLGICTAGTLQWRIDSAGELWSPSGAVIWASDGSASAPSLSFFNSSGTGFYRGAANRVDLSINATSLYRWQSTGFEINAAATNALLIQASVSGNILGAFIDNTSNTASSESRIGLRVAGTSAGDPYAVFSVIGGSPASWAIGVDNSDGDTFKINSSSGLAVGSTLEINASNQILHLDGSASLPTISFSGDPDTGIYRPTANTIDFTVGASGQWRINSTGLIPLNSAQVIYANNGSAASPSIAFNSDTNNGLYLNGTDSFAISTAGTFRWQFTASGDFAIAGGGTSQILAAAGTAAAPSYSQNVGGGGTNTGIYFPDASTIGFSASSVQSFQVNTSGNTNDIRISVYDHTAGTLKQVSRGATDSGGTGFRVLRIAN